MSFLLFDLKQLYRHTFGAPYMINESERSTDEEPQVIQGSNPFNVKGQMSSDAGNLIRDEYLGKEIWLPVKFVGLDASKFGVSELLLPYTTIKITGKKTIIKTPLAERKGTVKELFSIDDYSISIKGFVIDDAKRVWPEKDLTVLKKLFELSEAIQLDNALSNIFLDKDTRVAIETLELPEVDGGRKHIRPFSLTMESDSIFELDV